MIEGGLEKNTGSPNIPNFLEGDIVFPNQIAQQYNIPEEFLKLIDGNWYACDMLIEEFLKKRSKIMKRNKNIIDENLISFKNNEWHIAGLTEKAWRNIPENKTLGWEQV